MKYIKKKNRRKGFTLVELLAVIVIVAVILLIFIPNIANIVSKFQNNDKVEMLQKSAISAAKDYVSDNYNSLLISCANETADINISVNTLINNKYLDNNDDYKGTHKVVVTYDCSKRKFTKYEYKEN